MADVKSFDWTTHEREKVEAMERARGKGYGTAMMEGLYFHQNSEPCVWSLIFLCSSANML
jgi:hypothetical protein